MLHLNYVFSCSICVVCGGKIFLLTLLMLKLCSSATIHLQFLFTCKETILRMGLVFGFGWVVGLGEGFVGLFVFLFFWD